MRAESPVAVDRGRVLAFRLSAHNLAARLAEGGLLSAVAACGIQNTPPGAAHLSLHARVAGLRAADVDRALADRTLTEAWSLRASPHLFPTSETAVFTSGLLPDDESSLSVFMLGARGGLARLGMDARELVERTTAGLNVVLAGRTMTKDVLGREIAALVVEQLNATRLAVWESPSPVAAGQTLGESMVRFALPVASLQGVLVMAPRAGRQTLFVLADRAPGAPRPAPVAAARAELVRRYLRCYGPSTSRELAAWAGISPAQAARSWALVASELAAVSVGGRRAWVPAVDMPRLLEAEPASGVRFIPPHDPYLQCRDRELLLPVAAQRRQVWRTVGSPGAVLVDGEIAGIWSAQKRGAQLTVRVATFCRVDLQVREPIIAEGEELAVFRGAEDAAVVLESYLAESSQVRRQE